MAQGRATGILPVKEIMARTCPDVFDRDGHATAIGTIPTPFGEGRQMHRMRAVPRNISV
jgi:hypothetical protein